MARFRVSTVLCPSKTTVRAELAQIPYAPESSVAVLILRAPF